MSQNFHEEEVLGKAYDSRLMKRLLSYLKPYRWLVIVSVIVLIISSLVKSWFP